MYNNFLFQGTSTMPISISSDGATLSISLGVVTATGDGGGTYSETSTISLPVGDFSTLWIGLNSQQPDNSFRLINTVLNTEGILTTEANNVSFAGFYVPVG